MHRISLVKYVAQAGFCSRRKAAHIIKTGLVKINETIITKPDCIVEDGQVVKVGRRVLKLQKNVPTSQ